MFQKIILHFNRFAIIMENRTFSPQEIIFPIS